MCVMSYVETKQPVIIIQRSIPQQVKLSIAGLLHSFASVNDEASLFRSDIWP